MIAVLSKPKVEFQSLKSHNFVILDTTNLAQLCKYENAVYESFNRKTENQLVHKIWDWNYIEKRAKIRIPYEDQIIYTLSSNAIEFCASVAININPIERQCSRLGFCQEIEEKSCEAFVIFLHPNADISIFELVNFLRLCMMDLSVRGFKSILAICAPKTFCLYRRLGFKILETKEIQGETRHFIQLIF